jgi:predicted DNA-binding transcriptional regulator AlpA
VKELICRKDLARRLGIANQTLARWAVEGTGPAMYRIGRRVMYDVAEVTAWLETRRRRHTSDQESRSGERSS